MSDPMTNAEVEDVLSSIRRLVSEDKPAEQKPKSDAPVAEPETHDRLVLTPSLRVTDEAAPPDPVEDAWTQAEPFETEMHTGDMEAEDLQPEDLAAADVAEPDEADEVTQPPTPIEDAADPEPDVAFQHFRRFDDAQTDASEGSNEPDEGITPEPEPVFSTDRATSPAWERDDPFEENADAVPQSEEVPDDHVAFEDRADTFVLEPGAPTLEEPVTPAQDVEPEPEADVTAADAPQSLSLSQKIEALETLIAGRRDEWEPDDPGTDAYAGTEAPTMEWEDTAATTAAAATFRRTPEVEAEDIVSPDEPSDPDVLGRDEAVLDEEALRELVADIVREELQGALGERITRNVRKLVRREIHRALAAQELE